LTQIQTEVNTRIPWAKPTFYGNEEGYLADALESTWISGGYYVEKFEEDFARYNGSQYAVTTSNGTTAMQLSLLALGISAGDEVIVPGYTFVAPANMVIEVGGRPVYADVDLQTWCIDPAQVEKCITTKTKAIIAVHTYGNVCDMDVLKNLAQEHGLYLIEDTAEAALSKYKGKFAGTFGEAGCFSFQATKTITMGEGGIVLTSDEKLCEKMRIIRDHGMRKDKRYWHDVVGYNFRLTNLQAAVGCGQFENVEHIISDRNRVYQLYRKYLADERGITLQYFRCQVEPVVWAVAVKIDPDVFRGDRDFLIEAMSEAGIETRPGFYPFSDMSPYDACELGVSRDIGSHVISLPSFTSLTDDEIALICNELKGLRK
jgi:perosamine synthetase